MSTLPHIAKPIDLLKWVEVNPNKPFDPTFVVSLSTGHSTDWEWQHTEAQMEDLRRQSYIMLLRRDPSGSTYWTITSSGVNYLRALESFQVPKVEAIDPSTAQIPAAEVTPLVQPVPTPKKRIAPFMERLSLRIRRFVRWQEIPTHLTAQLTYDLLKYLVFVVAIAGLGAVSVIIYYGIYYVMEGLRVILR